MSELISLNDLPGVGPAMHHHLSRLGIESADGLINHFPFRYEDYGRIMAIDEVAPGPAVICGSIELVNAKTSKFRRLKLTEIIISDESGRIKIVWFNMPFLARSFSDGQRLMVFGKVVEGYSGMEMHNPQFQFIGKSAVTPPGILPVYSTHDRLGQKSLRKIIGEALKIKKINECLPREVLTEHYLLDQIQAYNWIHQPTDLKQVDLSRRHFAFEELFLVMLRSAAVKKYLNDVTAFPQEFYENEIKGFVENLPFKLTDDQRKSAWAIIKDLGQERPMNRLLEGEVGSGKTVVAAMAILNTLLNGQQAALMVPTEVLARQHYNKLSEFYAGFPELPLALLTASQSLLNGREVAKNDLQEMIKEGKVSLVIGTHALISQNVQYRNLGLVVIDEQHRFGVEQRRTLKEKNLADNEPHLLSLTATPIPRSLALIIYGDLDISLLKNLPLGRQKVLTKLVTANQRRQTYEQIKNEVSNGRQVFVVCPLIDPSDTLGAASVTIQYKSLIKDFPTFKIGLLHGKLSAKEKMEVMDSFHNGNINLLVSTTVVEVGIDVPNSTIMMIEGAERFGLAQLHQLRGRVGRGQHQSYCFIFPTDKLLPESLERLRYLERTDDGFQLAEFDLKQRGPGEVYGLRQSGLPELKFARLDDLNLIAEVKEAVIKFLENDSIEKYPLLKEKLNLAEVNVHME